MSLCKRISFICVCVCVFFQYRNKRQTEAEDVQHHVGNGGIFVGIPDGIVIAVESALVRIANQVQQPDGHPYCRNIGELIKIKQSIQKAE